MKKFIITSLLILASIAAPLTASAGGNDHGGDDHGKCDKHDPKCK